MNGSALEQVFRAASGRIVATLASRFRSLDIAEDALAEACLRANTAWLGESVPQDPAAWLYRVAYRCAVDAMRRRKIEAQFAPMIATEELTDEPSDEAQVIPDERLKLIFICCHPAVAIEVRAALTLRLVCGLSTREIARAFLTPEATLAQRLVRAKRKIADAGVPFAMPEPEHWPERLDAVLSTLEVAYAKAHEDAAGSGPHAGYASEVLALTGLLAQLLPQQADVLALAATTRFTEARRLSRLDSLGMMIPLSQQDPVLWNRGLIAAADEYLAAATRRDAARPRVVQAAIHARWCARRNLAEPPPWSAVLSLYDALLVVRDDPIVRLNRAVAVAEVLGVDSAVQEVCALAGDTMREYLPYHAVKADLLYRAGRSDEALTSYDSAIALVATSAERDWLTLRRKALREAQHDRAKRRNC